METIKFKTNIKCSGCIEKLTPALNEMVGKEYWYVDLHDEDKILTIKGEEIPEIFIQSAIEKVGFKLEKL